MAESGQLICVLAGPSEAVDQVKNYTKGVMGKQVVEHLLPFPAWPNTLAYPMLW